MEVLMENNCIGLIIQLKKHGIKRKTIDSNSNIVLGYYDSLEIRNVFRWYDFSPRNSYPSEAVETPSEVLTITHYPLKLLFPASSFFNERSSFNYDAWKNTDALLATSPCMSIILINLTDNVKSETNSMLEDLKKQICMICDEDSLKNANCCILPSLGYSDFCILMADKSWDFALDFVEKLHQIKINGTPILSTDYMMPIYHANKRCTQEMFPQGRLSVRINLEPGCTSQMLANRLPDGVFVYRTSGGSDCLLTTDSSQSTCDLFNSITASSNSDDSSPLNLIIDPSSVFQIRITDANENQSPIQIDYPDLNNRIKNFKEVIAQYRKFLNKHKQHLRQSYALDELATHIESICLQHHTGVIRKIFLDFIENFTKCLDRCFSWEQLSFSELSCIEERIDGFCQRVDSFLSDLSRADCFFMDRERYNHPSVSSTTSLLVAYNHWLNKFSEVIQKITLPEQQSSYKFLVTSGGCDRTLTENTFFFLDPELKNNQFEENLPLIIQMSEMSLYDFSGSILRIMHECMHYCGERYRNSRANSIIKFIASYYGKIIAGLLFGEDIQNAVIDKLCAFYRDHTNINSMIEKIKQIYANLLCNLENEIIVKLHDELQVKFTQSAVEPTDYLARNVKVQLQESLLDIFSVNEIVDGNTIIMAEFANFLYEKRKNIIPDFYNECDKILLDGKCNALFCAFDNAHHSFLLKDIYSYLYIQNILPAFLMHEDATKDGNPLGTIPDFNIFSFLDSVMDIYSETFADVSACTALNANFTDYVLMHIYEEWDLERALQRSFSNLFRIPVTLKICFPDMFSMNMNELTAEAKKRLCEAIILLQKHGLSENRFNIDLLIEKLDELIYEYTNNWTYAGKYLCEYLKECMELYKNEQLNDIQQNYRNIRLLNINPEDKNLLHQKIEEMLETFYKFGVDDV